MGVVSEVATAVAEKGFRCKPLKIKILTNKHVISACAYSKQAPLMTSMKKSASTDLVSSGNEKLTSSVVGTKRKLEVLHCEKAKRLKMDRYATSNCSFVIGKLLKHKLAYPFKKPVDPVELHIPDYFDIITSPMDLGTIKQKLDDNKYMNYEEFESDVRLTFSNAMLYNPVDNFVHQYAKELLMFFEHLSKPVKAKMSRQLEGMKELASQNVTEETMHDSDKKCLKFAVKCPYQKENLELLSCQNMKDHVSQKFLENTSPNLDALPGKTNGKGNEEMTEVSHRADDNIIRHCESLKPLSSQKVIDETMHGASRKNLESNFTHVDKLPAQGTLPNVKEPQELMEASNNKKFLMRGKKDVKVVKAKSCTSSKICRSNTDIGSKIFEKQNETTVGEVQSLGLELDIQLSPSRALRAAMLKSRFADTIFKAQQLKSGSGTDAVKLWQERERLERQQREEKSKIEAQIRAAETAARMKAECEIRQRREQERLALEKVEETVALEDNFHVLTELEGLIGRQLFFVVDCHDGRSYAACSWDKFERSPLEQLGLFMKNEYLGSDDDDDEYETMHEEEWEEGEVIF